MVRHYRLELVGGLLAIFLLAAWAGIGVAAQPAQTVKTPQELEADALLDKFARDITIERQQNAFMADNLVRLAKDKLEMGDFRGALHDFEKATRLDENNREALDGLKRTRGILNLAGGRAGDILVYGPQVEIAVQVHKIELNAMYADAKALFEKGQYRDAIEAFTRVQARALYLTPNMDVGRTAEDAAKFIQKSQTKLEEERLSGVTRARTDAAKARDEIIRERKQLLNARSQALYNQASTLFEQRRFEEARKVCELILVQDPTNGSALTLRESSVTAAHNEEIDRALKARQIEVGREWNLTRAMQVPQADLVYMPRERFEEVRSRKAESSFSEARIETPAWEAKIRESMNKKISFDFVETPLADVVTFISSLADVTIVLDTEALKDEPKTVTLRVNDMRLESALNWVLKLVGLKYTLKDEAVFVSKPDRIYSRPTMRMYDVSDLTIDIKNFQGHAQALATDNGGNTSGSAGPGVSSGSTGIGENFFRRDDDLKSEEDKLTGKTLVDFIRKTIAVGTWAEDEIEPK